MFGAYFNVLINLKDVTDSAFKEQVSGRAWGLGPVAGPGGCPQGCGSKMRAWGKCPPVEMFLWPPVVAVVLSGVSVVAGGQAASAGGGWGAARWEPPCPLWGHPEPPSTLTCLVGPPRLGSPRSAP